MNLRSKFTRIVLFATRFFLWPYVFVASYTSHVIAPFAYKLLRLDHRLSLGRSTTLLISIFQHLCNQKSNSPQASLSPLEPKLKELKLRGCVKLFKVQIALALDGNPQNCRYRTINGFSYSSLSSLRCKIKSGGLPGGRIDYPAEYYTKSAWFQVLLQNPAIRDIANAYYGSFAYPIFYTMWELHGVSDETTRPVCAQEFHWDWDVINPLNVFILCTDTSSGDGPLEYIINTHQQLPYQHDGPWDKTLIKQLHLNERIVRLTGNKGDVYVCDNTGLHRDSVPISSGSKVWLQLTFSPFNLSSIKSNPYIGFF